MIGLDTNILVRAITQDDVSQTEKAKKLIASYKGMGNSLFVNNVTLCELIWVLKSNYGYEKKRLVEVLCYLISVEEFCFQNLQIVKQAIDLYDKGKADFADYLSFVINQKAGCDATYSFDKQPIIEDVFTKIP